METRKKYELTVRDGKRSKVFEFRQATALETLEFLEEARKPDFSPIMWLFSFLNSKCSTKRPFYARYNVSKSEFVRYAAQVDELFSTVQKTYFKGAFGDKTEEKEENWSPDGAYWAFLAEKLSTDPLSLLERYTFEQIATLARWIVWNANAQTEEWKRRNEAEAMRRKLKQTDRDAIKEAVERLANYHKKP